MEMIRFSFGLKADVSAAQSSPQARPKSSG